MNNNAIEKAIEALRYCISDLERFYFDHAMYPVYSGMQYAKDAIHALREHQAGVVDLKKIKGLMWSRLDNAFTSPNNSDPYLPIDDTQTGAEWMLELLITEGYLRTPDNITDGACAGRKTDQADTAIKSPDHRRGISDTIAVKRGDLPEGLGKVIANWDTLDGEDWTSVNINRGVLKKLIKAAALLAAESEG